MLPATSQSESRLKELDSARVSIEVEHGPHQKEPIRIANVLAHPTGEVFQEDQPRLLILLTQNLGQRRRCLNEGPIEVNRPPQFRDPRDIVANRHRGEGETKMGVGTVFSR
jgi:hypothetical protein